MNYIKKITLKFSTKKKLNIDAIGLNLFQNKSIKHFTEKNSLKLSVSEKDIIEFVKRNNGLTLTENKENFVIYTDPFRTIPLYFTKKNRDELILFSFFDDYYQISKNSDLDEAGFWELFLFGDPLYDRTLISEVKQLPGSSKLIINKKTLDTHLSKYWNYEIYEDTNLNNKKNAIDGLYYHLEKIFSNLDQNNKYFMGLSGGIDSRLSIAFLSKFFKKDDINLFTFGFDQRVTEYKFAKQLCELLNFNTPEFYKITHKSYLNSLDILPKLSGGLISIAHSHTIDYLVSKKNLENTYISNLSSDALFGYACSKNKNNLFYESNKFKDQIFRNSLTSSSIKEKIIGDYENLVLDIDNKSNFSSIVEYKYITERNQKFHTLFSYLQSQFVKTISPYNNYDLLEYMLSVPIKFRSNKILISLLFEKYFDPISLKELNVNSSLFHTKNSIKNLKKDKILNYFDLFNFKIINLFNNIFRYLGFLDIRLFNKYYTEDQDYVIFKFLKNKIEHSLSFFMNISVINKKQKNKYFKYNKFRLGQSTNYFFNLISIHHFLKIINKNE